MNGVLKIGLVLTFDPGEQASRRSRERDAAMLGHEDVVEHRRVRAAGPQAGAIPSVVLLYLRHRHQIKPHVGMVLALALHQAADHDPVRMPQSLSTTTSGHRAGSLPAPAQPCRSAPPRWRCRQPCRGSRRRAAPLPETAPGCRRGRRDNSGTRPTSRRSICRVRPRCRTPLRDRARSRPSALAAGCG